jgi:hypothetical protein
MVSIRSGMFFHEPQEHKLAFAGQMEQENFMLNFSLSVHGLDGGPGAR